MRAVARDPACHAVQNYGDSDAEECAKLEVYCRPPPPTKPSTEASGQRTPSNNVQQKSASCSDITGTNSTAPAATDCKDANTHLHAARVTREKYPAVSADEYDKAAKAARRAGDTQLELGILREAMMPPPTAPAEEPCAAPMREAASYLIGAEAIKKEDATCRGLIQAAGKLFYRRQDISSGSQNGSIAGRDC